MFKKVSVLVALIFGSLLGLVACGDPYKNMSLSLSSYDADVNQEITLYLNKDDDGSYVSDEIVVKGEINGAGKGVSEQVIFPETTLNDQYVGIKNIKYDNNVTTFTLYGKQRGQTTLEFKAEGIESKKLVVNVEIKIENMWFKENVIPAIAEGESFDLGTNPRDILDFEPINTSQDEVIYTLENVNSADQNPCAKIENGVLKTVKGAIYPVENGVKVLKLRATSKVDASITDVITINVISITDELKITSNNDSGNSIELTKNLSGQYEIIMAPLLSADTGTDAYLQYFMSNREICIQVGNSKAEHGKYIVNHSMPANDNLTVTPITSVSAGNNYVQGYSNYQFTANKITTSPIVVTFTIDYVGDLKDNPEADLNKYKGLFTKTIEIVVTVTSVPSESSIAINGNNANEVSLNVFDYYEGMQGTQLVISEKFTALNLSYNINYEGDGYQEGLGNNTLLIYINGQYVDENHTFKNGDVLYLKHNYSSLNQEYEPYLQVYFSYSFRPQGAPEENYSDHTITKTIRLNYFKGIKEVELENILLEVNDTSKCILYEFPHQMKAESNVYSITSTNPDLYTISYENNIVYIAVNQNNVKNDEIICGKASSLTLTTTNGVVSNSISVEVYLQTLYKTDSKLFIEATGSDSAIFAKGANAVDALEPEQFPNELQTYVLSEEDEWSYDYFDTLVLSTNSKILFNVYNLSSIEDILKTSYVNMNVSVTGTQEGVLTWNVETGELITYNNITGQTPITLTVSLTAYTLDESELKTFTITNNIAVYIFTPIESVELESVFKQVYLRESIGYEGVEQGLNEFVVKYITKSKDGVVDYTGRENAFGLIDQSISFSNNLRYGDIENFYIFSKNNDYYSLRFGAVKRDVSINGTEIITNFETVLDTNGVDYTDFKDDGFTLNGTARFAQFGVVYNLPFSVNIKYAQQVENIVTSFNTSKGIDFEFKGSDNTEKTQTFSYLVLPNNALNKNFNVVVENEAGDEIHALLNGKCSICDCQFKDICNHSHDVTCNAKIQFTSNNGRMSVTVLDASLVGKLQVYFVPLDSYHPKYELNEGHWKLTAYTYKSVYSFTIYVNDGSTKNPFQIREASDFITMLSDINSGKDGYNEFHYEQVNDIDLSGYSLFNYVNKNAVFIGSYNGSFLGGSTDSDKIYSSILGVNITGEVEADTNIGLFGKLSGILQNINVVNPVINITLTSACTLNVGILAGEVVSSGKILNSRVYCDAFSVKYDGAGANIYAGSIAGLNAGTISGLPVEESKVSINNSNYNSTVAMKFDVLGGNTVYAGGLAGKTTGTLSNLKTSANISFANYGAEDYVGGAVGFAENTKIEHISVVPKVKGYNYVGGVAGKAVNTTLNNVDLITTFNKNLQNYVIGYVNVGGLVGYMEGGSVNFSYFQSMTTKDIEFSGSNVYKGSVILESSENEVTNIGGLVGLLKGGATLNNVMFNGDVVSFNANANISGIANYNATGEYDLLNNFALLGRIKVSNGTELVDGEIKVLTNTGTNEAKFSLGYVYANGQFGYVGNTSSNTIALNPFESATKDFSEFATTNGVPGSDSNGVVTDGDGNELYQYVTNGDGKTTYTQTAMWLLNTELNNGLPVLIWFDENTKTFKTLFATIATFDVEVLDFVQKTTDNENNDYINESGTQGHIKIDKTNLLLFYNETNGLDGSDNKTNIYTFKVDNVTATNYQNNVISISSDVLSLGKDNIVELNVIADYKIICSNSLITIDEPNKNLTVNGIGTCTLTLENMYDESNVVTLNVEIINGFTNFEVKDNEGELLTPVDAEVADNDTLYAYVDNTSYYTAKFVNVINHIEYNEYKLGGYEVEFKGESAKAKFKFNGKTVELKNDNQTTSFEVDKTTSISLQGLVAGKAYVTFKPYVYYNGTKIFVESLEKEYAVVIMDKAQSLTFANEHSTTIRPEGGVEDITVELITSNPNEKITMVIKNNETVIYNEGLANISEADSSEDEKTHLLVLNCEKIGSYQFEDLYKVIYNISLKMDKQAYLNFLNKNRYQNPLEKDAVFEITLKAESNELAKDTYTFTIAPNELEKIDVGLYPNMLEQEDYWQIDTGYGITKKLAPNTMGLLQISTVRKYNNVSYIEVTTNGGNNVNLQQLLLNTSNATLLNYVSPINPAILIQNGIRLWNASEDDEGALFNGTYYVLVNVGNLTQGSTLQINIIAYDYNGNPLAESLAYEVEIENLPSVSVNLEGLTYADVPLDAYKQITITSEHIDELEYYFKSVKDDTINDIKLYTFSNDEYKEVESNKLNKNETYYIGLTNSLNFTKYNLVITGKKLINGFYTTAEDTLTINSVLATIEGIDVVGTESNNTIYLPTSTFTALGARVVLNAEAMNVVYNNSTKTDKEIEKINDAYTKNIILLYRELNKQISGNKTLQEIALDLDSNNSITTKTDHENINNIWYLVNGNSDSMLDRNGNGNYDNFKFSFYSVEGKESYFKVESKSLGSTNLKAIINFGYKNGLPQIGNNDDEPSTEFNKRQEHAFTLTITDNSTADHPNPIYTQEDLLKLTVDESNIDGDGNVIRPHYILMNDITLGDKDENGNYITDPWKPIDLTAASFDGNSYVITIESFDFSDYNGSSNVSVGLFSKISEHSILKNVTINISPLLVSESKANEIVKNSESSYIDLRNIQTVNFGLVTPENEGTITNTKVVSLEDTSDKDTLLINTTQGYYLNQLTRANISPFVVNNKGSISYSFVGVSKLLENDGKISVVNSNKTTTEQKQTYEFKVFGGNNIAGFVNANSNLISNSYVNGVSIKNLTNVNKNSSLGGFAGTNSGKIYSSFISDTTIESYRASASYLESKGSIAGFVFKNSGTIENTYAIMQIVNRSVETGGFVYENTGVIRNSYTTSIPKLNSDETITDAHGWFISQKVSYGILENCYYYLMEGEVGLLEEYKEYYDDNVLKQIDPATPIFNAIPAEETETETENGGTDDGTDGSEVDGGISTIAEEAQENTGSENTKKDPGKNFSSKASFDGFVFTANAQDIDGGIWFVDETKTLPPTLINCVGIETVSWREISSVQNSEGEEVADTNDGTEKVYNYIYQENNEGSINNPILVHTGETLLNNIISKSSVYYDSVYYDKDKTTNIKVFGFTNKEENDNPEFYNPRYIRLVNNIDLSEIDLHTQYTLKDGKSKAKISDIIFNGVLAGNGMTISGIKLNNTSEQVVEDYGLFKQVGLTSNQKTTYNLQNDAKPLIYNLNLKYTELQYKNARKVGVLAGSVYDATLYSISIEGPSSLDEKAVILGNNLVGAVAGYIAGEESKISYITVSNVKLKTNNNPLTNLSDAHDDLYGFYNKFSTTGEESNAISGVSATFDTNNKYVINNLSQIAYAGGVAGIININNLKETDNSATSKYDYEKYHYENNNRTLTNLTIKNNFVIQSDQAGGLFGGMYNTHLQMGELILLDQANDDFKYQSIFGYYYAGGISGEMNNSVLDQCTVAHEEAVQLEIDNNLAKQTSVSKNNDLFRLNDPIAKNVSVAIGGMAGYTTKSAVVFSSSKVNVCNQNAKIAGGLIGFAEENNYIGYSFTTGNVYAKDIIGGLVGFYLNAGFDMYLFNAYAVNVWGTQIETHLRNNSSAIYKHTNTTSIRMPEIGNQIAVGDDHVAFEDTYKLPDIFDEPLTYVYIGSVYGKVSFKETDQPIQDFYDMIVDNKGNITIRVEDISNGYFSKKGINKNLFIGAMVCENGIDGNLLAIPLIDVNNKQSEIEDSLNQFIARIDTKNKEYYTYYNDYFFNVFSSTYSTISTSGKVEDGNFVTTINSNSFDLMNKACDVDNDNDKIKYENIIGNQYYVSYITGDYYVSDVTNSNYARYENEFTSSTGIGYTSLPRSKDDFETMLRAKDNNPNNDAGITSTDYDEDFEEVVINRSMVKASDVWYVVNNEITPTYTIGKVLSFNDAEPSSKEVSKIYEVDMFDDTKENYKTTNMSLQNFFTSKTKDRTLTLSYGQYYIVLDSANKQQYARAFQGNLVGLQSKDGKNPVITILYKAKNVNTTYASTLFDSINNAQFTNIDFDFVIHGDRTDYETDETGYYGMLARKVNTTVFDNCNFNIYFTEGATSTVSTLAEGTTTSSAKDMNFESLIKTSGLIFGYVGGSSFTNISFKINNGLTIKPSANINAIGGFIGELEETSVSSVSQGIKCQATLTTNSNISSDVNIGGLFGKMLSNSSLNGYSTADGYNPIIIKVNVSYTVTTANVGGLVGIVNLSKIENVNIANTGNITHKFNEYEYDTLNIGGIAGKTISASLSNIVVNGVDDNNELSINPSRTLNLTVSGAGTNINFGGFIGLDEKGSLISATGETKYNDENINRTSINNAELNLTLNASVTNVAVGGFVGSVANNNSTYSTILNKVINIKDVNVANANNITNLYIGGLAGKLNNASINTAYSLGDVYATAAVDNSATNVYATAAVDNIETNVYAGGVVGYTSLNDTNRGVAIENVIVFGDIKYGKNADSNYYGGVIGYNSNSPYKINNVITTTHIVPQDKLSDYNLSQGVIRPFGYFKDNDTKSDYITNSKFINEQYLHVANSENAQAKFGVWLADLAEIFYENTPSGGILTKSQMLLTNTIDGMPALVKTDKTSDFVNLSKDKFNINFITDKDKFKINFITDSDTTDSDTTLSTTLTGYNLLLNSGKGVSVKLTSATEIGNGAIVSSLKTESDYSVISISGDGKIANNYGAIANIAINISDANRNGASNFLTNNYGYMYNVVVYGTDEEELPKNLSGFAENNYGYICQSGVNITYTNKPENDIEDAKTFSGMVNNNVGEIQNSYSVSNILYCDKYKSLISYGISAENTGVINKVFVGGKISNSSLSIAENKENGKYSNVVSDADSNSDGNTTYEQMLNKTILFDSATYKTLQESLDIWALNVPTNNGVQIYYNHGYPYIKGGIKIPTVVSYGIENENDKLTHYQISTESNKTLVINSLRGVKLWNVYCGSSLTSNNNFNIYFTQSVDGKNVELNTIKSVSQGYGVYGNGYTLSNFEVNGNAFINVNKGSINNLIIDTIDIAGTGSADSISILTRENAGVVNSVTITNPTVGASNYSSVSGIALTNSGTIEKTEIDFKNKEYSDSTSLSADIKAGGIAGTNSGKINDCKVLGYNLKLGIYGNVTIGGIAGSNAGSITNCSVNNVNLKAGYCVGGIVGYNDGGSVTGDSVETANKVNNATIDATSGNGGGIIGKYSDGIVINNIVTDLTLTAYNAGGIIGTIEKAPSIANSKVTTATINSGGYAGGLIGYSVVNNPKILDTGASVSGLTINYSGFTVDLNKGWFRYVDEFDGSKRGTYDYNRFGEITHENLVEVFKDNITNKYRHSFKDEDINYTSQWYGPTNINSGVSDNDNIDLDSFYNNFTQNGKGDESVYYTTFGCADGSTPANLDTIEGLTRFFSTARGFESENASPNVGLLYGFMPSEINATADSTSIIKSNSGEKMLIDSFTHWVYIAIEGGIWTGNSENRVGVMVLEFRYYFNDKTLTPGTYNFIDDMFKLVSNTATNSELDRIYNCIDINFAFDMNLDVGANNFNTTINFAPVLYAQVDTGNSTGKEKYHSVANEYKNVWKLFTNMATGSGAEGTGKGLINKFIESTRTLNKDWDGKDIIFGLTQVTQTPIFDYYYEFDFNNLSELNNSDYGYLRDYSWYSTTSDDKFYIVFSTGKRQAMTYAGNKILAGNYNDHKNVYTQIEINNGSYTLKVFKESEKIAQYSLLLQNDGSFIVQGSNETGSLKMLYAAGKFDLNL